LALALIMGGQPAKHVARQLGRSRGTVEDWVRRFNAHGLAGLQPTFRGQPGTRLTSTELVQLKAIIQRPPRQVGLKTGTWTGKGVAAFVTRAFGNTISAATARRYLHRLGFGRKRPRQYLPRRQDGRQTLIQLCQACLALALHGQGPTPPACPKSHKKRKSLRCCQGQEGIRLRLDDSGLPTAVKQKGRKVLSERQTMRMGELLGQSQRLLTPPYGPHRIAQAP
jgi:putative transposase